MGRRRGIGGERHGRKEEKEGDRGERQWKQRESSESHTILHERL